MDGIEGCSAAISTTTGRNRQQTDLSVADDTLDSWARNVGWKGAVLPRSPAETVKYTIAGY